MYGWLFLQGEGLMFLFTDSQIVDERMLVYINDLLSSGEIPDLFAQEDKDEIVNAMRSETKAMGLVDTTENCWATFIQKARLPLLPLRAGPLLPRKPVGLPCLLANKPALPSVCAMTTVCFMCGAGAQQFAHGVHGFACGC